MLQIRRSHGILSLTWECPYLGKAVFILRQGPRVKYQLKKAPIPTHPHQFPNPTYYWNTTICYFFVLDIYEGKLKCELHMIYTSQANPYNLSSASLHSIYLNIHTLVSPNVHWEALWEITGQIKGLQSPWSALHYIQHSLVHMQYILNNCIIITKAIAL